MLAYKTFKKEYEEYLDMLLGGDEFLMRHKIIREDAYSKYRFSSLIREELARRLDKNLQELTAEDHTRNEMAKQIQLDKIMIMLIENPQQLWKHLNAKVKNAWMERVVVRKRVYRNLTEGFDMESTILQVKEHCLSGEDSRSRSSDQPILNENLFEENFFKHA